MTSRAVDIIIVNFNTRDALLACLRSLRNAPPARPHHIVVVDNASTDGSADAVRQAFAGVRVVQMDTNAGFAKANNAGIRTTHSPLVLLLNSDTIVPAGTIDILCDRLDATSATIAGPRLIDAEGRPEMSWGSMLSPWTEWIQTRRVKASQSSDRAARAEIEVLTSRERQVDWVSGACLLVERRAAEDVGLLDERYFMYEEDVDFCAAIRSRRGTVLFTPAAQLTHLRGQSHVAAPARRSAIYDDSHLKFYQKHAPGWVPFLRLWKKFRPADR